MGAPATPIDLDEIAEIKARVEGELYRALESAPQLGALGAAAWYALFPEGKRIRPCFALAFARDLGADERTLYGAVTALELLHASSLIHDDLPALDNDDMRRGKSSCHRAHGEAIAILAGDALIACAMARVADDLRVAPEHRIKMVAAVARAFVELCDGQALDLQQGPERRSLVEIAAKKTGALFGASLSLAAIGAGMTDQIIEYSAALGREIGICFQIVDDLLDSESHALRKGRAVSSDSKNQKITFLTTHGEKGAAADLQLRKEEIERQFGVIAALIPEHSGRFPLCEQLLREIFP